MLSEKQNTVKITKDNVKRKLKSVPDWKGAGPDKIQGFWWKSFTAVHEVLAAVLNECIEVGDISEWLVGDERFEERYWSGELQTNCLTQIDMKASDRNH